MWVSELRHPLKGIKNYKKSGSFTWLVISFAGLEWLLTWVLTHTFQGRIDNIYQKAECN